MSPREMEELGCEILLGNTYHLNVDRRGPIERRGGLHTLWVGSILTDSGGYQVLVYPNEIRLPMRVFLIRIRMDGAILSDRENQCRSANWPPILRWFLMNALRIRVKTIRLPSSTQDLRLGGYL